MSHKDVNDRTSGAILAVSLLFYLFFAVYDGAVICVDSPSYIDMDISREPFYPLFLALLRFVFSGQGDFYLTAAAFLQSFLAAVAAWSLADFFRKEFRLSGMMGFLLLAMPLATSLLCRFAAQRSSMYSNSILTEGIACSLYLLFARFLMDYCFHQKKRSLIWTCVISFVLISTRKQMYLCLILLVIALIYVAVRTKCYKKGLLTAVCCSAVVWGGSILLDCSYNLVLRDSFTEHSSDNRFLATMVFYNAKKSDGEAIEDPELRALFDEIYDACEENGFLKDNAPKGWYQRVTHFAEHYDNIQIDTMWRMVREYVYGHYEGDPAALEERVDAMMQEMTSALLPGAAGELALTFLNNVGYGMVTTIAQCTPVLIAYSVVAYLAYLILLIWNLKKNGLDRLSVLGIFTFLSIAGNVAVVSALIFAQARYTIYNMPLFYISGLLLFANVLPENVREKLFVMRGYQNENSSYRLSGKENRKGSGRF